VTMLFFSFAANVQGFCGNAQSAELGITLDQPERLAIALTGNDVMGTTHHDDIAAQRIYIYHDTDSISGKVTVCGRSLLWRIICM